MLLDSQHNRFYHLSNCYKDSLGFILRELLSYKIYVLFVFLERYTKVVAQII